MTVLHLGRRESVQGVAITPAGRVEAVVSGVNEMRRPTMSRRHEETILRDIVELAERYDTPIRTALRVDIAPEDAILRQARLGRYDLVVMGVGRPAGETLYFGKIAAAVKLATLDPVRVELTRIFLASLCLTESRV